jgi:hypothetical protein
MRDDHQDPQHQLLDIGATTQKLTVTTVIRDVIALYHYIITHTKRVRPNLIDFNIYVVNILHVNFHKRHNYRITTSISKQRIEASFHPLLEHHQLVHNVTELHGVLELARYKLLRPVDGKEIIMYPELTAHKLLPI